MPHSRDRTYKTQTSRAGTPNIPKPEAMQRKGTNTLAAPFPTGTGEPPSAPRAESHPPAPRCLCQCQAKITPGGGGGGVGRSLSIIDPILKPSCPRYASRISSSTKCPAAWAQDIHRSHGLAVLIQTHVEGFAILVGACSAQTRSHAPGGRLVCCVASKHGSRKILL